MTRPLRHTVTYTDTIATIITITSATSNSSRKLTESLRALTSHNRPKRRRVNGRAVAAAAAAAGRSIRSSSSCSCSTSASRATSTQNCNSFKSTRPGTRSTRPVCKFTNNCKCAGRRSWCPSTSYPSTWWVHLFMIQFSTRFLYADNFLVKKYVPALPKPESHQTAKIGGKWLGSLLPLYDRCRHQRCLETVGWWWNPNPRI